MAAVDLFDESDAGEASPASSNYSSCDGSDFERYCSANSALGSASFSSSVGNYSDLLDSIKNLTVSNGFDGLSDGGSGTPKGNGRLQDLGSVDGMSHLSRIRTGSGKSSPAIKLSSAGLSKNSASGSVVNGFQDSLVGGTGDSMEEKTGFDVEGDGKASARCEYSDDDDSVLDYGSNDEGRGRLIKKADSQCSKELRIESGNPLVMNSSVAFGSGDWDEFVQETGGNDLALISLYGDQPDHTDAPPITERNCQVLSAKKSVAEEKYRERCVNFEHESVGREVPCVHSEKITGLDADVASQVLDLGEGALSVTNLCKDISHPQSNTTLTREFRGKETEIPGVDGSRVLLPVVEISQKLTVDSVAEGNYNFEDAGMGNLVADEANRLETFDSYDEMVLEMEEILLDSGYSRGERSTQANHGYSAHQSHHFRDGSSTASTSGTDDVYPLAQYPSKIDRVEVVGAKQKKGDVSFGERLVGVKEYTVYKIRVLSGKDQWEVERRYRDFLALYRQLTALFTDHGLNLPSPWSSVERESRKIFGNASPNVISERSALIQDCLCSILNSKYPFGTPSTMVCFLTPGKDIYNPGYLKSLVPQSLQKLGQDQNSKFSYFGESSSGVVSMLGTTISLVVEIRPRKSIRQLLEAQHYTCAGCHRHLDAGKTLFQELVQTFGWNRPRFCEYTGQLFCASCHTDDTAVLPAKVLHHWDFSLYPVSQLAKAYLESIYEQPMLCVSAVNPFLFSKVPALLHVMSVRKSIGAMLAYVRCPFRRSVQRSLGIRRYLLESNDFFALRELVDLSKGPFAALPGMVETVSSKILEHITQQCLVCYDSGIPCAARQACDDPSSLIFPFQEAEAEKCGSCGSIFHKPCFVKLMGCCPCGKRTASGRRTTSVPSAHNGVSDRLMQPSCSTSSSVSGFLSEILSKARPDKMWRPKNRSPVILMGSLPSTNL